MNTHAKGNRIASTFDAYSKIKFGWIPLIKEHAYRMGPIFKTCSVMGFDRLYLTSSGFTLCEITVSEHRADHLKRIKDKLLEMPNDMRAGLLESCTICLVCWHQGNKTLDKRYKNKKVWTSSGLWQIEWIGRAGSEDTNQSQKGDDEK
jgi:hypothetical protein